MPLIIVAVFGVWGAKTLDDNEAHAANGRVITVIGYSFAFEYRYDSDGGFTRNDGLYVPVGEPITLHMITPLYTPGTKNLEVIHSFWVPEWGVKQDATPGVNGQDRRHDLRQADAGRHLRGAVHRAVRLRPRRDALQEHPRAQRRRPSRPGSRPPRPTPPRPSSRPPRTRGSPSSTPRAAAAATRSRRPRRPARSARRWTT